MPLGVARTARIRARSASKLTWDFCSFRGFVFAIPASCWFSFLILFEASLTGASHHKGEVVKFINRLPLSVVRASTIPRPDIVM